MSTGSLDHEKLSIVFIFRISPECFNTNFCVILNKFGISFLLLYTSKFPRWMAAFSDEDMNNHHINLLVFISSIANVVSPAVIPSFFCWKWKIFVMYWWFVYFIFWNSVLGVAVRTSFLAPVEYEDTSLSSCFQGFEFLAFSCLLTWEYSIGSRLGFRISFLTPGWSPCPFSTFPRLTRFLKSCGGFFLALNGLCITRFMGLDFAIAEFIGFGFAIGETFTGSRFLSSLRHGTLLPDRTRKKITEMAAREHREIHNVEQTKKMIPLITRKTLFGQHVSELVFGVNTFWFGLWRPNWFCQTTNPTQLCGFWTRVSLLDFVLW